MELPPHVEIRRATLRDKAAVLAMNEDAFFGMDNMDHYFDRYVTHPNYMAYVLLERGQVVSFQYAYLTDDFSTKTRGGQRTLPAARHKKYQLMLDTHVTAEVERAHGQTLRRNIYISNLTDYQRKKVQAGGGDLKIVCMRNVVSFKIDMALLRQEIARHETPEQIRTISSADFDTTVDTLLSPENKPEFFPQNFFVVWEVYAPLKSNFDLVKDICTMRVTQSHSGDKVTSLSFCHVMQTKGGLRMDLENYGGHLETLRGHVIAALRGLVEREMTYEGTLHYNMMFPRKWGVVADVERFVMELGFDTGEWSQSGGNEYCVIEYGKSG